MHKLLAFILVFVFSLSACGKPITESIQSPVIVEVDSYKVARTHLFGELHYNNGVVTDVYCEEDYDSRHGVGRGRIPNPELLNCEHTWPQSKFKGHPQEAQIKVDLHHLFPSASFANTARLNHPFGEVDRKEHVCGTAYRGNILNTRVFGFEPPDSHKGNVARAMFYVSFTYRMPIDPVQEFYFRKWHRQDPVDSFESIRNRQIRGIQGNSNPFIDQPFRVDQIRDF